MTVCKREEVKILLRRGGFGKILESFLKLFSNILKMPPWRWQLKLLGKILRQIKKTHSTDLHGGVKGILSVGFFLGHAITVPAIVFAGQGVKSAYRIFSCTAILCNPFCCRVPLLQR